MIVQEPKVIYKWIGMAMACGFMVGASIVFSAISIPNMPNEKTENQQLKIHRACKLPDVNGAMTVFVMEDDKLKCWRWK